MSSQLYGKLQSELKVESLEKCRQITREVINFGVSQEQILKIIYLLALELDDVQKMKAIADLVRDMEDGIFMSTKQESEEEISVPDNG